MKFSRFIIETYSDGRSRRIPVYIRIHRHPVMPTA